MEEFLYNHNLTRKFKKIILIGPPEIKNKLLIFMRQQRYIGLILYRLSSVDTTKIDKSMKSEEIDQSL